MEVARATTEAKADAAGHDEYIPSATSMNDGNFKPLFRHCLRNLSSKNVRACDHVSAWDTSRLKNCSFLLYEPTHDSQEDWMLFQGAEFFNVNISGWQTTSCTTMRSMFRGAASLNQPLHHFDTSRVTDMSHMFHGAEAFDQDLQMFNTERVTDMSHMFRDAIQFSGRGLSSWNVSKLQTFYAMFNYAVSFDDNIGHWDVRNAKNFESMFDGAHSFNQDIGGWNVQAATSLKYMFRNARSFNQDLSSWETEKIKDFTGTFKNAISFRQTLCWNLNDTQQTDQIFEGAAQGNLETDCHKQNEENSSGVMQAVGTTLIIFWLVLMVQQLHRLRGSRCRKSSNVSIAEEEEILFDSSVHSIIDYFDDESGDNMESDDEGSNEDVYPQYVYPLRYQFPSDDDSLEMTSLETSASELGAILSRATSTGTVC